MKEIIRRKTFETNSSSSHSMTQLMKENNYVDIREEYPNGVKFDEYDKESFSFERAPFDILDNFYRKLQYLISSKCCWNEKAKEWIDKLNAILKEKTGIDNYITFDHTYTYDPGDGLGYVDHESLDLMDNVLNDIVHEKKCTMEEAIIEYLTNKNIFIVIDGDEYLTWEETMRHIPKDLIAKWVYAGGKWIEEEEEEEEEIHPLTPLTDDIIGIDSDGKECGLPWASTYVVRFLRGYDHYRDEMYGLRQDDEGKTYLSTWVLNDQEKFRETGFYGDMLDKLVFLINSFCGAYQTEEEGLNNFEKIIEQLHKVCDFEYVKGTMRYNKGRYVFADAAHKAREVLTMLSPTDNFWDGIPVFLKDPNIVILVQRHSAVWRKVFEDIFPNTIECLA